MCTRVAFTSNHWHLRRYPERVFIPVAEPDRYQQMVEWLAVFENGTSGFFTSHRTFDTYSVGDRPWRNVSAFWFSDSNTAFAFKMQWA